MPYGPFVIILNSNPESKTITSIISLGSLYNSARITPPKNPITMIHAPILHNITEHDAPSQAFVPCANMPQTLVFCSSLACLHTRMPQDMLMAMMMMTIVDDIINGNGKHLGKHAVVSAYMISAFQVCLCPKNAL